VPRVEPDSSAAPPRQSTVRALPAGSRWAHQPMRLGEWVRERFWAIPLVLIVLGVLVAVVVSRPEVLGLPEDWGFGNLARTSTADAILQVMASSMLTFVGVVFAITLVGLQLASSQLSPRVIRTFVRSAVTKTAFGVFLATFAFALTALAFDDVHEPAAAARTVAVSVLMLAVSVAVFVVYVTATMRLLEVGWVITAVADEARNTIHRAFPPARSYVEAAAPVLVGAPRTVHLPTRKVRGRRRMLGTVLAIDRPRLVRLAAKHECVIELLPRVGEYVPTQAAVFAVHGGRPPDDRRLIACLDLGRSRSLYQDPTFGIRQLVDVGTQALSPAINQMTTAVQVIDRLQDLVLRIGRRPVPSGLYTDPQGTVRLVEPTVSSSYLLDLAFQEISQCGAASWHVTRRLAAAYADLGSEGVEDWREPVARLTEALDRLVRAHAPDPLHLAVATRPDRLGLG
jgi:uncharacterized membrane protein